MLPIKPVCLALALFSLNSIACSGVPSASFYYQPWGQGTKYIVEDSDGYGLYFPDIHLPQVRFKQLRRVSDGTDDEYDSPDDINNDFVRVDGGAYIRTNGGWRFDWLTDGRHILWAGKIVPRTRREHRKSMPQHSAHGGVLLPIKTASILMANARMIITAKSRSIWIRCNR